MNIFFHNIADNLEVETDEPLFGSLEQAVEIFHNLPDYDGSYLGLVNTDGNVVQISKYDRFLFLIEIPIYEQQGAYSVLFTYFQVMDLLAKLYQGFDPYDIPGLNFDKYIEE